MRTYFQYPYAKRYFAGKEEGTSVGASRSFESASMFSYTQSGGPELSGEAHPEEIRKSIKHDTNYGSVAKH